MIPAPAFLSNPERFMAFSRWAAPMFGAIALALALAGLWLGFTAPEDYQQGDTVRIMFIHVPAAWMSMFVYVCLAGASFLALVFRHALADAAAQAALLDGLARWTECLQLPPLARWQVSRDDYPRIIAQSRGSSMKTNPVVLRDDEVAQILDARLT